MNILIYGCLDPDAIMGAFEHTAVSTHSSTIPPASRSQQPQPDRSLVNASTLRVCDARLMDASRRVSQTPLLQNRNSAGPFQGRKTQLPSDGTKPLLVSMHPSAPFLPSPASSRAARTTPSQPITWHRGHRAETPRLPSGCPY
jgi:hypothetical protein